MGRAILPTAKLLLFTVDQQIGRALATAQSVRGSLTVGFYPGLASSPLGTGIAEFRSTRPDVELRLVEGAPSDLHRQLNERVVDIIFVTLVPKLASAINMQERLWDEPLIVAVASDHPLAIKDSLQWADLASTSIMLRSQQGDLSAYRAIAARMGDHQFDCDLHDVSRGALIEIVRLGLGATILLASAAVPRDGVAYLPIVDALAHAEIQAIWPKDDRNPLRHRLLSCVRRHATTG